jgi:hypothetical protein
MSALGMRAWTPSTATSPSSRFKFEGSFSTIAASGRVVVPGAQAGAGVEARYVGVTGAADAIGVFSRLKVVVLKPPLGRRGGRGRAGHDAVGSCGKVFSLMPNIFLMLRNMFMSDYGTVVKQDCDTTREKTSPRAFPLEFAQVNAGVMIRLVKFMVLKDSLKLS